MNQKTRYYVRYAATLALVIFLFLFPVSLVFGPCSRLSYCERCGLERHEQGLSLVSHPLAWMRTSYSKTIFCRLYQRTVMPSCSHRWHTSSFGYNGGIACGHYPLILSDYSLRDTGPSEELLRPLLPLCPPNHIAVLLQTYDLRHDTAGNEAIHTALYAFRTVHTPAEETLWWKHYASTIPRKRAL